MSHAVRLLVVFGAWEALPRRRRPWLLAGAVALWSVPIGLLAVATTGFWRRIRHLGHRRTADRSADAEVAVLGELVALGLAAGMTFVEALRRAGTELTSQLRTEVDGVVRSIQRDGSSLVLETATGRARRLYVLAGRAMITGAPILDAVEMFVDESRAAERSRRQAAVRRLPVTLVFPLALLILPGFVIVVLAPAMLGSLQRFTP